MNSRALEEDLGVEVDDRLIGNLVGDAYQTPENVSARV
jgi:hypothetical protein